MVNITQRPVQSTHFFNRYHLQSLRELFDRTFRRFHGPRGSLGLSVVELTQVQIGFTLCDMSPAVVTQDR